MKPTHLRSGIVCLLTLFTGAVNIRGADGTDLLPIKQAWRSVSDPSRYTYPTKTIVDANGDVLVAGSTSAPGAGSTNIWVAKYSGTTGAVLWETIDFLGWTRDATVDSQGNLIIAGSSRVEGMDSFSVAKFSAQSGQLMWHRTNEGDHYSNEAQRVIVDANDNVVASGHLYRLDPSININAYTVKYSSGGVFQWEQEYDNPSKNSDFSGLIAIDAAGDVLVVGSSLTLQIPGPFVRGSLHVAKYNGVTGAPVWEKLYENGQLGGYAAADLELDSAGNLIVGGSWNLNHTTPVTDAYVAAFSNSNGDRLWEYAPQHTNFWHDSITDLIIDSDGSIFAVGFNVGDKYARYSLRLAPGSGTPVPVWERRVIGTNGLTQFSGLTKTTRGELIAYGEAGDSPLFTGIDRATGESRWSLSEGTYGPDSNQLVASTPDGGFVSGYGEAPGRLASIRKYLPTVAIRTDAAEAIAPGSIRLHGTVHPNGFSPKVWFEWGADDSLTNSTPEQTVGGDTQVGFEATLSGLAGGTYSYRAVAQYGDITVRGAVATLDFNATPVAVNDSADVDFRTETIIDVLQNDSDADGDALQIIAYTQPQHGTLTLGEDGKFRFNPGGDFVGNDSFEYTITDGIQVGGAAAEAHAVVAIHVERPSSVFIRPILSTGDTVAGDEGTTFAGFMNPGPGLILASVVPGTTSKDDDAIVDATGQLVLKVGGAAPGSAPGSIIARLDQPSGRAFVATVRMSGQSTVLQRVLFAQMDDGIVPIMQEGAACPGLNGVKFKKLLAFDGSTDRVFFLASLKGPHVRPGSDCALWVAGADGLLRLILREGDLVDGDPVRGITSLVSAPLSGGEQRWVDGDRIGARLQLGNRREVLVSINLSIDPAQVTIVADTAGDDAGYARFSLPAFDASSVAVVAKLKGAKANQRLVLDAGNGPIAIAETGTPAPGITDGSFLEFADPVLGANNALAFAGTIKGAGIGVGNNTGLWLRDAAGNVELIARSGDEAPGVSGSRWANFRAIVFPDDGTLGPVFSADLVIGQGSVTAGTRSGLWAVDSGGAVRLLLRAGDTVDVNGASKVLKSIRPVSTPKASVGGYDDIDGHIYVVAVFSDRSQSILKIVRP